MTLVQTELKKLYIGSTPIKRVTIRPNGTEKQIRPAGWQPGANTLAYWKLNGNLNDEMGYYNGAKTSGAIVSYVALPGDNNVKCMKIYSGGWDDGISLPIAMVSEILSSNVNYTFGGFINMPSVSGAKEMFYLQSSSSPSGRVITNSIRDGDIFVEATGQGTWFHQASLAANTRYSVIFAYNKTTYTRSYYINGILLGTDVKSVNYSTASNQYKANLARLNDNTLMSNMFLEKNVARTEQDAMLYHNTFKALYGL